jgi:NADH:ubiquinone oxidoreductase subunit E
MLQEVQSELGFLPREALEKTSTLMSIPLTHVYGVATFYHQFRLRPKVNTSFLSAVAQLVMSRARENCLTFFVKH